MFDFVVLGFAFQLPCSEDKEFDFFYFVIARDEAIQKALF
jgi:hypothetical protein